MSVAEALWKDDSVASRAARAVLAPASVTYSAATRMRNALYEAGVLRVSSVGIPVVSVGNLSVGGTGKTPVAAWIAGELERRGSRPAVVMRGYGDDEPVVHRELNPGVPVVVDPDRVRGARAAASRGAGVVVLDDAFQHRRIHRDVDIVLLACDGFDARARVLPAGPLRESPGGLARASLVVLTRKAATGLEVSAARDFVASHAPGVAVATAHLTPVALRSLDSREEREPGALRGKRVLVFAAIANPAALVRQLEELGGNIELRAFPDHHAYSEADIRELARAAREADLAVCTLKDAVKLRKGWPREAVPPWYVSQRVIFEEGEDVVRRMLDGVHGRTLHAK
jgi:tetraacyldisaccharide 4'-kinase